MMIGLTISRCLTRWECEVAIEDRRFVPLVVSDDSNSRSRWTKIESSSGKVTVVARTLQVECEMVEPNFEMRMRGETF